VIFCFAFEVFAFFAVGLRTFARVASAGGAKNSNALQKVNNVL